MWFRTDLRLADHPALREAMAEGPEGVVPLVVLDDHFWGPGASVRQAYLVELLRDFARRVPQLHVVHGKPAVEVPRVAAAVGAHTVHVSADFTPYGGERDRAVEEALRADAVSLVRTGSPYAVSPGRILKGDGTPYKVFTPYFRAWQEHGWRAPAPEATEVPWITPRDGAAALPSAHAPDGVELPAVGEVAALERWRTFLQSDVADYAEARDVPGDDRTSRMSVHLKWGTIHPRTMLAELTGIDSAGADAYVREIAFRDFYADVLHHRPDTVSDYYDPRFAAMQYDDPADQIEEWKAGRTGYPIVDAGMRQLLAEGWMHNRVRMIVASFLVKDLHIEWQHGAAWFLDRLVDADLASNQHGWQWTAGCGTDASPYFRIFNPTTQGKKFDPTGRYVRRWVPELRDVPNRHVHEPWTMSTPPSDYPPPMVDHAEERVESLRRYDAIRS